MRRFVASYMSVWLWLAMAGAVHAEGAIDAWAQWALTPKVWKGQTVPAPDPAPRPNNTPLRLDSQRFPVHVHLPAGSSETQARAALRGLEEAYDALQRNGWPLPADDGGYGGTQGFDLYLVAQAPQLAAAEVDAELPVSDFDGAQTYATVSAELPASALSPCIQSALAQAGVRAVDPAEAQSWVRATGELAAWLFTGAPGCADSFLRAQQQAGDALLTSDPASGARGALLLAVLSERRDGGSGTFIRSLWESTRQRSRGLVEPDQLRGSPDLWEALDQTLAVDKLNLLDELSEFAVARYFAGQPQRRAHAAYHVLRALPSEASVPLQADIAFEDLPRHLHDNAELGDLGSAYVRVHTADAGPKASLQVWLKGELGPQWSLQAVRLAADGHELGRTSAPPRRVPSSFLPIAFGPDTADILLVVTNLPATTPDADKPPAAPHSYELILAPGL